jgi:hypothetical protein
MLQLNPGDIFCTRNPMALGRAINAVQRFHAIDNESKYSHAGIITDSAGTTFESLWTIRHSHLREYLGQKVLIGRHAVMGRGVFEVGYSHLLKHEGRIYPFHRLFLHLIPPLAKYVSTGRYLVCSELVGRFLYECGLKDYWKGVNPDHVADWIRKFRIFEIVFEGELRQEDLNEVMI